MVSVLLGNQPLELMSSSCSPREAVDDVRRNHSFNRARPNARQASLRASMLVGALVNSEFI